jgi:hypothetical protein
MSISFAEIMLGWQGGKRRRRESAVTTGRERRRVKSVDRRQARHVIFTLV